MKKILFILTLVVTLFAFKAKGQTGTIGEIRMFAGNFAPYGWMLCDGSLIPISQNTALFSIIGTYYGGNGQTNFALPDLRGRAPMHKSNDYSLGEQGGAETVTLITSELPAHTHQATLTLGVNTNSGDSNTPIASCPAKNITRGYEYAASSNATMGAGATYSGPQNTELAGGSQPHNNMQPYVAINYIICVFGDYPVRP